VSGVTGVDGVYAYAYAVQSGGVVRATAQVRTDDEPLEATLLVYGDDADQERAALAPRDDLLRLVSSRLGGTHQALDSLDVSRWVQSSAEAVTVDRHQEVPMWNTWAALLLVVLTLALEWFLRRRWGFV
jgi:hypothetical protein